MEERRSGSLSETPILSSVWTRRVCIAYYGYVFTFLQYRKDELMLQVNDAHCPGSILDADSTFEVAFKPRPEVHIQPATSLRQTGRDFQHKGLCAEEEDQVAIKFKGESLVLSSAGHELTFRPSTV
jgi:hypothetical protein